MTDKPIPQWCKDAAEYADADLLQSGGFELAEPATFVDDLARIIAQHAPPAPAEERAVKNRAFVSIENALNGNDGILAAGYTDAQITALAERTVAFIKAYRPAPALPFNGHTELPWHVGTERPWRNNIFGGNNYRVAAVEPYSDEIAGANAAFIVHACNTYYQREQALKACVEALEGLVATSTDYLNTIETTRKHKNPDARSMEMEHQSMWSDAIDAASAALAQAREVLK